MVKEERSAGRSGRDGTGSHADRTSSSGIKRRALIIL